jgi:predicted metal-dependent hydrolase
MEILENLGIPYNINWTSSRTVSIKIDENGVIINAGQKVPIEFIDSFLAKKKFWIKDNWKKYESARNTYLHLGKEIEGPINEKFYREETRRIVEGLVKLYNIENKFEINNIFIKSQKTRWGSCSNRGNLNFNWKLSMAPPEVIEYVVIHELCHRLEMNHSSKFWAYVKKMCPDYKNHKNWLKKNHFRLTIW